MVQVRPLVSSDWPAVAAIFAEGIATGDATFEASLALHRAVGFREVGVRERIGQLDGAWRDVVLLELRL